MNIKRLRHVGPCHCAAAQRPEPVWAKVGVGAPEVITREVDVLSAERGKVDEQRIRHRLAAATRVVQRPDQIDGRSQDWSAVETAAIGGGALSQLDSPRLATRKLLFRLSPEPEQTDLTSTGTLAGISWG